MSHKNHNTFDVIISGGGLSGSLSALSLSTLKKPDGKALSIAIIEAHPVHESPSLSFDSRVLALSHASVEYLKVISVWQNIRDYAEPIKDIHISDRGYYGKARVSADEHNVDALGYVVEMAVLGQAFLAKLSSLNNITWFSPDSIEHIQWQQEQVNVTLQSSLKLSGKLLLACDGGQSQCRELANISVTSAQYQQSAIIANISMAKHHKNVAFERFTESGPIAILPLKDNEKDSCKCSLVWTVTPKQAEQILALSDCEFKQALEEAFGSWLGAVKKVGKRVAFPLSLITAEQQVYHRTVLVGNSSHTIHPIAGQGFNLGLRDVEQLANTINENLKNEDDIGNFHSLNSYAQSRKKDHQTIIMLTNSLVTLFSNHYFPLVIGRNIGLKVLNYISLIKKSFVNKTMGY